MLNASCGHRSFIVPSDLAPGNYLVRAEVIALHVASSIGGALFYVLLSNQRHRLLYQYTNRCLLSWCIFINRRRDSHQRLPDHRQLHHTWTDSSLHRISAYYNISAYGEDMVRHQSGRKRGEASSIGEKTNIPGHAIILYVHVRWY